MKRPTALRPRSKRGQVDDSSLPSLFIKKGRHDSRNYCDKRRADGGHDRSTMAAAGVIKKRPKRPSVGLKNPVQSKGT